MSDLRVSIVQAALHWHEPAANRDKFNRMLEEHVPETDLIVFPEMFTTGFTMEAETWAESMDGPSVQWMQQQARKHNAALTGSLIIRDNGLTNRMVFAFPDGKLVFYDKRHRFRMAKEHEHFDSGTSNQIVDYKGWKLMLQVCYDLRFPVWSRNRYTELGLTYDAILYVANWPEKRGGQWIKLLQARAIENQAYVIGVNRTGRDGNSIRYRGDSAIYDPWGDALTEIVRGEGIESQVLSREILENYRSHFPAWQDADAFELID